MIFFVTGESKVTSYSIKGKDSATELEDSAIIEMVLAGDTDAFETLIRRHEGKVFKIVSSHVPTDEVEAVANDIFFKSYKSLATFKNDAPFINWLSVIAVRTCNDYWRNAYTQKDAPMASFGEETEAVLEQYSNGCTPEDDLLRGEMKSVLNKAMDKLKPNERTIINMLYAEERSVAETAELVSLSESNVKVTAFRARKKLAEILNRMVGGAK